MASPTQAAVAAIQAFVAGQGGPGWTATDAQILAALNAQVIPNPATQARVAKPFTAGDLLSALDQPTAAGLLGCPALPSILTAINAGDTANCNLWIAMLAKAGAISPQMASTLTGVVNATIPDPSYVASLSWAQVNLGRPADEADVAEARPQ